MTLNHPSWIAPLFNATGALYPAHDSPILAWHPGTFEAAFVALHPFYGAGPRTWAEIAAALGMSIGRLNRGLLSSIGALRTGFRDEDAALSIEEYCARQALELPLEGRIPDEWNEPLAQLFRAHGTESILVRSEFGDAGLSVANSVPELEAALGKVQRRAALLSETPGLLVTVDWDSFFTLVFCTSAALAWVARFAEGFVCDPSTTHYWGHNDA